jgi:hypothetical protein
MKQIFKEKYSHISSFNIPFYEGMESGPNEVKFFTRFDADVRNGLKNANWFWGPKADSLFKTTEGREEMFATLFSLYTLKGKHSDLSFKESNHKVDVSNHEEVMNFIRNKDA